MSIGMPIVASRVIGNIDTIKNNHSGFFYKLGDIKQASKCIKDIINNENLKLKFSINAYERHRKLFSTEKWKFYISLYKKFLDNMNKGNLINNAILIAGKVNLPL